MSFGAFGVIKALIVDGQNNHDWKKTTPELEKILLDTGLFKVDIATSPTAGGDMSSFNPKFKKYDVVVLNYNGDSWNSSTQGAFVKYVKNGGGIVVVHAADNSFGRWEEYNEIIGFGGWGNRTKSSGPYIHWVDGELVFDHESDGPGGAHEGYAEFVVASRDLDHPIMKGMPEQWYQNDELYNFMRGPGKNMHVLATAHSKRPKNQGGSGKHEPMLFTVKYGKGNIFHTTLGHNVRSMKDKGFLITYARGAEWAATGQVTIPMPGKMPEMLPPHEALTRFDGIESVVSLVEIVSQVSAASSDKNELNEIEQTLIATLQDDSANFLSVQAACNTLGLMNSADAVPALTALLAKSTPLSDAARLGLQRITDPAAGKALVAALSSAPSGQRVGIIVSIGARRESNATTALADIVGTSNSHESKVAVRSLGQIGTIESLELLQSLERNDATVLRAINDCAYEILKGGYHQVAAAAFQSVLNRKDASSVIRQCALLGYVESDPENGMEQIWEKIDDPDFSRAARFILGALPAERTIVENIAAKFPELTTRARIEVLPILASKQHEAALPLVLELVQYSSSMPVIEEATKALGSIPCNEKAVKFLAVAGSDPDSLAHMALVRTPGEKADKAIIFGIKNSDGELRATYIEVARKRGLTAATDALIELALENYKRAQKDSLLALSDLGRARDFGSLLRIPETLSPSFLPIAADAVRNAGRYLKDDRQREFQYLQALRSYPPAAQAALLPGLTDIPSDITLRQTIRYGESLHQEVRFGAYETLAQWPTADSLKPLLDLAEEPDLKEEQAIIMQAFAKAMKNAPDTAIDLQLEQSQRALKIGLGLEEKRVLINVIRSLLDVRSLKLLEQLAQDPELERDANAAIPFIKVALMEKPGLTSSHNSRELGRMLDGNSRTRWSTNGPMKGGEWLTIDVRMPSSITGVTLDTTRSNGDYPRGYEMYISSRADDRGQMAAKGEGTQAVTEILLDKPVEGQYITIVQTGSVSGLYWSIHELKVHHLPLEFTE
jgi:hypothetical protein